MSEDAEPWHPGWEGAVMEAAAQKRAGWAPGVMLVTAMAALGWAFLTTEDRFNCLAETLPAMIGAVVLAATYWRFGLTNTSYGVVWVFALVLIVGGRYTYAAVPIGDWAKEAFGLTRNHFDRVGHFFQGVVPAILARELLLRTSPLKSGKWLFFLCVCVGMFVSAMYELVEWWYAVTFGGERAEDFLGSQGDVWDAQADMLMALIGGMVSQLALGWVQDRELRKKAGGADKVE